MKLFPRLLLTLLLSLVVLPAFAAPKPVKWSAKLSPVGVRAGEGAQVILTGEIDPKYHIYALTVPADTVTPTTLTLMVPGALTPEGKPVQSAPKIVKDPGFQKEIGEFYKSVAFGLPVTVKSGVKGAQKAVVQVRYQACDARSCLPPMKADVSFTYTIAPGKVRADHKKPIKTIPVAWATFDSGAALNTLEGTVILIGGPEAGASAAPVNTTQQINDAKKGGLFGFILQSFGFGLAALLTPCVFPMIPITVSYFTKRKAGERGGGAGGALAYCLGIVATFTVIGIGVTLIFGGDKLARFAANPYVNLGFALLFVVLALNLMGLFEIALPSGLANKAQSAGTKRGGYAQPFLLGLAFTLTSFTCTTAYVGTLLALAAKGDRLYPIVGMLGFSTAFALPFFLLALFPQALAKMPKSGSWLVTVKAFMGMLELAAAVKFLSQAEISWGLGLLTRSVFLASWAVIGIFAGLYLLDIVRLPKHDRESVGPTRRAIGVVTAFLGLYCFAAIKGAPLGWFEGFPPPPGYGIRVQPIKFEGEIVWLKTYEAALQQAKATNKPILINFTGKTCTNCRLMEDGVFTVEAVKREFRNYVTVELFTDRGTPADDKNQALEDKLVNNIALPYYVVVSPDGKVLKSLDGLRKPEEFVRFLQEGRNASLSASL